MKKNRKFQKYKSNKMSIKETSTKNLYYKLSVTETYLTEMP